MSGTPTEAEIQTQWKNAVALFESIRNYSDGTVANGGGLIDVIEQSAEGEYLPAGLAGMTQRVRSTLSSLLDPSRVAEAIYPVLYDYASVMSPGLGGNYTSPAALGRALYEHFIKGGIRVTSRAITYDSTATLGGSNVGNYSVTRLTVDENGQNLEGCTVETKVIRCRQDRNTGVQQHAELFEVLGKPRSQDNLLRASFGSGDNRAVLRAMHAGATQGGSLLNNSTFSVFSSGSNPKFSAWTESFAGGGTTALISQDTANFYRGSPGSTTDASLKITGSGSATVTLTQSLDLMRISQLDFSVPYLLRIMVNKTIGAAAGGSVTIRCGSKSATSTIAALATGWTELVIASTSSCWPKQFNQNGFSVQVEWSGGTGGYLLIDDVIFTPWQYVDGTYWSIRPLTTNVVPVNCLVDDTYEFTDTGGAPATAKLQWWWWVAGLGYLPTTGATLISDP